LPHDVAIDMGRSEEHDLTAMTLQVSCDGKYLVMLLYWSVGSSRATQWGDDRRQSTELRIFNCRIHIGSIL